MRKILQSFLVLVVVCVTPVVASPIPETHIMNVYWEVAGAPPVVWSTVDGVPNVICGYLVGYATGYNRPPSTDKVFNASFSDYNRAVAYLSALPNPVFVPGSEIAR